MTFPREEIEISQGVYDDRACPHGTAWAFNAMVTTLHTLCNVLDGSISLTFAQWSRIKHPMAKF